MIFRGFLQNRPRFNNECNVARKEFRKPKRSKEKSVTSENYLKAEEKLQKCSK